MPAAVEITERLLSDAGGWQALKQGKGLWEAGAVAGVTYEAPLLRGSVREGGRDYRAGLRIVTRTNIENLCGCRLSRERGMVCAHSMAVGVAFLRGEKPPPPTAPEPARQASATAEPEAAGLEPGRPQFALELEGSLNHLTAALRAHYGERSVRAGQEPDFTRYREEGASGPAEWRARNVPAEQAALERLRAMGFAPGGGGELALKGERAVLRFLAAELPRLEKEWRVAIGERFGRVTQGIERIRPQVEIRPAGENWFEMTLELATPEGRTFSSAEIQQLLRTGQTHVRMKNGGLAVFDPGLLDELGDALADCEARQAQPGTYRIPRVHAGYLAAVLGEGGAVVDAAEEWQAWTRRQLQPDTLAPEPLGKLEDVLRPYQKHGVYWMRFLARNGLGGVLADEMGLGKTLQALAFLTGLPGTGPALIVCPSSLVRNWARESARFTPELPVTLLEGPERAGRLAELEVKGGLGITSYPLLRRDAERYAGRRFRAVILDEAQHIKNPETQNAQAAWGLWADARMVLTGTPLENSVRDLWSIMQFVQPGYLGSREEFKERYEQPIAGQGSEGAGARRRLARRMRPFLLRRTKREVCSELPEKLEQVLYCDLTTQQVELYQRLLLESQAQLPALATQPGRGRMLILTALLRLRQACCDLRLLGMDRLTPEEASAKLELLGELLREAIDGGHRVLVFSQFVAMLQLQKTALEEAGIPYCYLDGQTRDRMAVVDRFQGDPGIPVFLISLKAGGTGLNLTGADTVVHFDPWWNPAVEAQATDRAHRIGQERVVTAYKLIARGTVEEKILKLQESKRGLLEAIESEEPVMSGLTTAEIEALLA